MPPPLALLVCVALVFVLLRFDRRLSSGVSGAIWIPTLWLLSVASKPLAYWFSWSGESTESGSPLDQVFLVSVLLLGVGVIARRQLNWRKILTENRWVVVLIIYMLISIIWSEIPLVSFKRWIRELIAVVMALVVLSERKPFLSIESILRRSAYILIPFSLVLIKYFPALGVQYGRWSGKQMWIGVTLQKNGLGRLCLISSFFLIWIIFQKWAEQKSKKNKSYADVVILIISLYLLKGPENAYSATSVASLVLGIIALAILYYLKKMHFRVPLAGFLSIVLLLLGFGVLTPFFGGATVSGITGNLGRDDTLTGRTETWAQLVPLAMSNPVIGCGYGSFWTSRTREQFQMSHGHNGYLDLILEQGFLGLIILSAFLVNIGVKLHKILKYNFYFSSLGICFLLMSLIYNTTESAFSSLAEHMTAVLLLISCASLSAGKHPEIKINKTTCINT